MEAESYRGILTLEGKSAYLQGSNGERFLEGKNIWEGYITHWLGRSVKARRLPQCDYKDEKPILILWPDVPPAEVPFVELYYNERLIKYPASFFGHNAINVNGEIFNFSHLLNENEVIDFAEFMYRPALGEFAPSPRNGKFEIMEDGTPYYDKFGRNFMRTIHVLRIEGVDVNRLSQIYHDELKIIHSRAVNPLKPEKYKDFNFLNRSCTTIIRDGLRKYGFNNISGILPRDLFVSTAFSLIHGQNSQNIRVKLHKLHQLKVPEAAYSKMTLLFDPNNWRKVKTLPQLK